jgi:hypothetical protein
MRTHIIFLFLGILLLYPTAWAEISLTVNGQTYEALPLKIGQTSMIEIRSDNHLPYTAYVGFDDGDEPLGSVSNPAVFTEAGNLATISFVTAPPLYGCYVNAAGISPPPAAGLHFRFAYNADAVGQTILKLYDSTLSTVLDSIVITVESEETGTGFTYQGRLLDDNRSAEGFYDFVFTLFSDPSEGTVIGAAVMKEDVEVADGYFTVLLDFGDVFGTKAQWLQMSVRPGDSTGDYTTLMPRQRLTPAPHATYAAKSDWNKLENVPSGFADGIDNGLTSETDPTVPASLKDGLAWSEILNIPAGFADRVDDGILTETDPTVPAGIKDGLSWSEIMSIPAGFADGIDNDTILSESQVENFIANDINSGYVPYDNGTKLVSSPLYSNGQETAIGSGTYPDRKFNVVTDSDVYGIYSDNTKTSGNNFGVVAAATGSTTGTSYGLFGASLSANGTNFGVYGTATTASTGINYGVYGTASNSSGSAYAGYFAGDMRTTGILNKDYDLRMASDAGAEVAIGTSIDSIRKVNLYTNTDTYGLFSENALSGGERYGLYGVATGDTNGYSYGVFGKSLSGAGHNFGVWGEATAATPYTNYAIYGVAANSGSGYAFAGYFVGDVRITGGLNKDYGLQIATASGAEVGIGTESLSDRKLYVYTDSDTYGVYSSISGGNPMIGGVKYGVYGSSNSSACTNYGVYGRAATDSQETNYGVYGYARNTTAASYAGYFDGAVHVTTNLFAGGNVSALSFTDRTPYPKDLETAYDAVMSMERLPEGEYQENNKEQQLDHSKLSVFIRSEEGNRDLSATVSCLNEVVKDLVRENQELKARLAAIEAAIVSRKAGGEQ